MILGKLLVPGRPKSWIILGQKVRMGVCVDIFTLRYLSSSLSPSLWETA